MGEAFVEKGIVRIQQAQHAVVFAQIAFQKKLRFLLKCRAQVLVEFGEGILIRVHVRQIAQIQPLSEEITH